MLIYLNENKNNRVEVAPYWNVNYNDLQILTHLLPVEVAPYWNVNTAKAIILTMFFIVEVAPYWNVNLRVPVVTHFHFSISRSSSILECKWIT